MLILYQILFTCKVYNQEKMMQNTHLSCSNNKGTDQPTPQHSLISTGTFDICFLKSILATMLVQGSHRLEKYLNIQDCLEKSLKIKLALRST